MCDSSQPLSGMENESDNEGSTSMTAVPVPDGSASSPVHPGSLFKRRSVKKIKEDLYRQWMSSLTNISSMASSPSEKKTMQQSIIGKASGGTDGPNSIPAVIPRIQTRPLKKEISDTSLLARIAIQRKASERKSFILFVSKLVMLHK